MKTVKTIIEVVKIIGLIAHVVEVFDYVDGFIRKRKTLRKPNPVGFNTEEVKEGND